MNNEIIIRNSTVESSVQTSIISRKIFPNPEKLFKKPKKVTFPHLINMENFRSQYRHLLKYKFRKRKKYIFTFFRIWN